MAPPLPAQSRALDAPSSSLHTAPSGAGAAAGGSKGRRALASWQAEEERTRGRLRKGTRAEDAYAHLDPFEPPAFSSFSSSFQTAEYLAALCQADPHDVERITQLPYEARSEDDEDELDEPLVSADCWVYEHLRRLCRDLSLWVVRLQKECSKDTCPEMKAADWLFLCAAHTAPLDNDCCAIEYILHTIDGGTALLNSPRYFPSRLQIPDTSLKHFTSIARRLGRIFGHTFFHHREIFEECESETALYSRFLALATTYDLVDADQLVIPLQ